MTARRFKRWGSGSFSRNDVSKRAAPENPLLRELDSVLDWGGLAGKLIPVYRGEAKNGRPLYDPVVMLKVLFLGYLYALSERQSATCVNDSLAAQCSLGLAVDEAGPAPSTLTRFK